MKEKREIVDCPNCLTPSKCNEPHLTKLSDFHYVSSDGYYLKENQEWSFIPYEKYFNPDKLLKIAETLKSLK